MLCELNKQKKKKKDMCTLLWFTRPKLCCCCLILLAKGCLTQKPFKGHLRNSHFAR